MQDIKQQEIKDFSPRDVAIQVMKAIEVADITQWNGKNIFEASDYDAIFQSIEDGVSLAVEQEKERVLAMVLKEIEEERWIDCPPEYRDQRDSVNQTLDILKEKLQAKQ